MKFAAVVCLFVLGVAASRAAAPAAKSVAPGEQRSEQLDRPVQVELQYLLYLPEKYDQQDKWPLMLFLHGAGERGDDLDLVKVHGPPKLIAAGKQFPMIVASPQCPAGQWWQSYRLSILLDELVEKYNVDKDRIYVTGLSMGGYGTWDLAAWSPDRFAAIAPICGGGNPYRAKRFAKLPVWAFHGAKDPIVPLAASQVMVDALKQHGGEPKLTVYPDAGHDSWTEAYDDAKLYEWLLSHSRAPE